MCCAWWEVCACLCKRASSILISPLLLIAWLQEVRDDYGSSLPVMLFTLRPQSPLYAQPAAAAAAEAAPAEARRQRLNEGLSLALLAQQCSTYTVVAPPPAAAALPALRWQPSNVYHASGLCAAALDTATLPYRLAARDGPAAAIGARWCWFGTCCMCRDHDQLCSVLAAS